MKPEGNRIHKVFREKKGKILSVYFTAGFPHRDDTVPIALALEEAGADIIEIGIPFSDPVADGPTIQASNKIALDNGMNVKLLLEQVREIRKTASVPLILMGYLNPVMQYGIERFVKDAHGAGVDGLILPDMPADVYQHEYKLLFDKYGMANTFLISPTTSEDRIQRIDSLTSGFIYAVSASSTTGARSDFSAEQKEYFSKLKGLKLKNPFLIGFGISNNETFNIASSFCSGAIVGSAFINAIKDSTNLKADIETFVKTMKGGVDVPA